MELREMDEQSFSPFGSGTTPSDDFSFTRSPSYPSFVDITGQQEYSQFKTCITVDVVQRIPC
jgi:hypothetical protein